MIIKTPKVAIIVSLEDSLIEVIYNRIFDTNSFKPTYKKKPTYRRKQAVLYLLLNSSLKTNLGVFRYFSRLIKTLGDK